MIKIKLGARVELVKKLYEIPKGARGTIIGIEKTDSQSLIIMFDQRYEDAHNAATSLRLYKTITPCPTEQERSNRCLYIGADYVEALSTPKLIICKEGSKVIAKLLDGKRTVATGIAKCSPSDTFNFLVGAQLAMQRCIAKQNTEPLVIDIEAAKELGIKFNP